MIKLTQDLVKSIFDYKDGFLYWKVKTSQYNRREDGKAGSIIYYPEPASPYWQVRVLNKNINSHRIIFLWHHGWLPDYVDHADLNTLNNLINNLRACTKSQNCANVKSHSDSFSQYLGAYYKKDRKRKWQSAVSKNGISYYLGSFETEEEAALAYNKGAVIHHGEFANLNIIKK